MKSRMGIPLGKRVAERLTATAVARAKPGYVGDGKGLYLRVADSGAKSWVFRYRAGDKLKEMGLGSASTDGDGVSLHEAREKAQGIRKELRDWREGLVATDPLETRRATKQSRRVEAAKVVTFGQVGEAYLAAHQAGWGGIHAKQWRSTLERYVYPVLGGLPVAAIDTGLVMQVLEPIWTTRPETASRVRGRIEVVLDYAKGRGWRSGENPALWKGHLEIQLPKRSKVRRVEHLAALPYGEMAGFMSALRSQHGVAARALEFTVLTAARSGEVRGATWAEVNLAERVWTIPASRMKAGREHRVPLSDAAMSVLGEPGQGYLFKGSQGRLGDMALLRVLGQMGVAATVHGFRSAFSDWCTEQTTFASEVREMALAHAVGNKVEAAYRRGDLFQKRRALAEAWARWCAGEMGGEVVSLRA